ncbi:DUF4148 domain-containing protein [Paraburkholderia sabiae]|uniref:DUF4148 domain-containing protein n=1 Tax=Paraburkholderia sabiae TaxID=273251 RepID=A0ABU9Q6G3_9BURK|nr:DUF4148 domain-containing protein [Paraburkholderia sabiae]WJZ78019.1 DUF4148 domain-containing protein [Paraburkholderia sabiae]CAD6529936.1 hypothetical protein LMG24235_02373 [Paraburkholderia sabiae]
MNGRFDKRALAGCIVMGGLALAAVVLHIESNALSDLWPFHHEDVSMTDDPQNAPPPLNDAPPVAARDDTSDADIAFVLQAVTDNLQRNDLTTAKVLLDEVLAVHSDLPQALALQQELRVREARAAHAKPPVMVATSDNARLPAPIETRETETRSTASQQDRSVRSRQVASHGTEHGKSHRALGAAQRKHTAAANGRPKTRAEVVAELRRARANGTMPNFGGRQR